MVDIFNLSEKRRIDTLKKALKINFEARDVQMALLKKYSKEVRDIEPGFAYFLPTLEFAWKNIDFAVSLGSGRWKAFNVYPTRVVFETVFRIEYYINKKVEVQNDIWSKEILRVNKRFHEATDSEVFKENHDNIKPFLDNPESLPDIEEYVLSDPFPRIEQLIKDSKLKGFNNDLYFHYRYLSEANHAKLLSIHMQNDEVAQYRRSLVYIFWCSKSLLTLTNSHISNETSQQVKESILKADELFKP